MQTLKIKRIVNGQEMEFELTANEMSLAYEYIRIDNWRNVIEDYITDNEGDLDFENGEISREEFIDECMTEVEWNYPDPATDDDVEYIVTQMAQTYNLWKEN